MTSLTGAAKQSSCQAQASIGLLTTRRIDGARVVVRKFAGLTIFVAAWSLFWARALGLVGIVPMWMVIFGLLVGLALIPWVHSK